MPKHELKLGVCTPRMCGCSSKDQVQGVCRCRSLVQSSSRPSVMPLHSSSLPDGTKHCTVLLCPPPLALVMSHHCRGKCHRGVDSHIRAWPCACAAGRVRHSRPGPVRDSREGRADAGADQRGVGEGDDTVGDDTGFGEGDGFGTGDGDGSRGTGDGDDGVVVVGVGEGFGDGEGVGDGDGTGDGAGVVDEEDGEYVSDTSSRTYTPTA